MITEENTITNKIRKIECENNDNPKRLVIDGTKYLSMFHSLSDINFEQTETIISSINKET